MVCLFAIARFVKQEELSAKVSQSAVMASADKYFEKLGMSTEDMESIMKQVAPLIASAQVNTQVSGQ